MRTIKLVIVGGGPAGLAAAITARELGLLDVMIIERECELGGILNQCIHNGFGLHTFHEELTGPEYAKRYVDKVLDLGIEYLTDTMVVDISKDKVVTLSQKENGVFQIKANAIILAMGCRERPRGALRIPGYRPAGIYTAGTAQYLVNIEGKLPGKEVMILGSGDIGLIMARRLSLEGAHVKLVAEIMPYSGGLTRNLVQCLNDYHIPLLLNHTITMVHGKNRVTGVTIAQVDENKKARKETKQYVACDTLLLSVGLIPENELSSHMGVELHGITNGPIVNHQYATNIPGVFACGNVLHVHDLVDFVSEEANLAGKSAVDYLMQLTQNKNHEKMNDDEIKQEEIKQDEVIQENMNQEEIKIHTGPGIRYTVPMRVKPTESIKVSFRVTDVYRDCSIVVTLDGEVIFERKKKIVTPGEMEYLLLLQSTLVNATAKSVIRILIQEA